MEMRKTSSIFNSKPAIILIGKALLLLAASLASLLAFVLLVPDGNDYALATRIKQDRLRSLGSPKIVLVGGSNLAYGIDSHLLEKSLARPVVNMGMNGYLGTRFMFEEVKDALRPGDLVLISLEYDSFYKSADGAGPDLLMLVKARPQSMAFLTSAEQARALVQAIPLAAQQKCLRLLSLGVDKAKTRLASWTSQKSKEPGELDLILQVESLAGFESHGDLLSHLDVAWPYDRSVEVDLSALPIMNDVLDSLKQFHLEMRSRGVAVVLVPCPFSEDRIARHKRALEQLFSKLRSSGLVVLGQPDEFFFPQSLFFDTVYHLNREGRSRRTSKVVDYLATFIQSASVTK